FSYYPSLTNHLWVSIEFLKNNQKYEMTYEEEPFLYLQREENGKIVIPSLSFSKGFNIFQYSYTHQKWFVPPQDSDLKYAINQMEPMIEDIYLIHYSSSIYFSDGIEFFPIIINNKEIDFSKVPSVYQEMLKKYFEKINVSKYMPNP